MVDLNISVFIQPKQVINFSGEIVQALLRKALVILDKPGNFIVPHYF